MNEKWKALSEGGQELMPLDEYPFSKWYGWIQDKYGLSWQIIPSNMNELLNSGDKKKTKRVTEGFLKMKKFDLDVLNSL